MMIYMRKFFNLLILFGLALGASVCSSRQDKMVYDGFERARNVAVLNGIVPKEKPRTPAIYYQPNGIHQQFSDKFISLREDVKAGIEESWELDSVFFPENASNFSAELVAGIYVIGHYEKVSASRYKLVLESWLTFQNDRMNRFFGNPKGYLAAKVISPDRSIPEHDEYVDKNMQRKAFEYLMKFIPPELLLPTLKKETKEGTAKIIREIKEKNSKR